MCGKLGQYLPLLTLCVMSVTDHSEGGRILPDTNARRLATVVERNDDSQSSNSVCHSVAEGHHPFGIAFFSSQVKCV